MSPESSTPVRPRSAVRGRSTARSTAPPGWALFYRQVRRIPAGCVATYGQIAALAGRPRHARQVGYALHALPENSDVPWHRVVNARGEISLRAAGGHDLVQKRLLRREGVRFDASGRIDLSRYQWGAGRRV